MDAQLTELRAELKEARELRREVDGLGDFSLILDADRTISSLEVRSCLGSIPDQQLSPSLPACQQQTLRYLTLCYLTAVPAPASLRCQRSPCAVCGHVRRLSALMLNVRGARLSVFSTWFCSIGACSQGLFSVDPS